MPVPAPASQSGARLRHHEQAIRTNARNTAKASNPEVEKSSRRPRPRIPRPRDARRNARRTAVVRVVAKRRSRGRGRAAPSPFDMSLAAPSRLACGHSPGGYRYWSRRLQDVDVSAMHHLKLKRLAWRLGTRGYARNRAGRRISRPSTRITTSPGCTPAREKPRARRRGAVSARRPTPAAYCQPAPADGHQPGKKQQRQELRRARRWAVHCAPPSSTRKIRDTLRMLPSQLDAGKGERAAEADAAQKTAGRAG